MAAFSFGQHSSATPPQATCLPEARDPRSRLDTAIKAMNDWTHEDRQIFVASFTGGKPWQQVANELGISHGTFHLRKRDIVRRFMRAAQTEPAI